MPRHRLMLAGVLAAALAAATAVVSLTFAAGSAAAEPGSGTVRVSVDSAERQSTSDSNEPAISADGRYVAFATDEPFDPVDRLDTSPSEDDQDERVADTDVYVRDTDTGVTTLISHGLNSDGAVEPARGGSDQPSISADGRFVAFRTNAFNIAPRDFLGTSIVVCDRDPDGDGTLGNSCAFTTVSGDDQGAANPHIDGDGRRLSYDVPPVVILELAPPPQENANAGWIVVVNLRPGQGAPDDDEFAYVTAPAEAGDFRLDRQNDSTISADGRHVAFIARYRHSDSDDLWRVYDYNVDTGGLTRLDLDADGDPMTGEGREFSHPTLSGDGSGWAFADRQAADRIAVRAYDRGRLDIASRRTDGTEGLGDQPALSADGRYLAFTTPSAGMHDGTDDSTVASTCVGRVSATWCDVVVRDLVADRTRAEQNLPRLAAVLASPSARCAAQAKPCEGTGDSGRPDMTGDGTEQVGDDGSPVFSADGSVVAYGSDAEDLVGDDTNRNVDVFVHAFEPGLAGDPQDFGDVPLGAGSVREVELTHVGAGPLRVTAVAVDGADFDVFPGEACTTVILHVTEKCLVSVRFRPTALGVRPARLRVSVRGLREPVDVALTGTGVTPPTGVLAAAPAGIDFGARPVLRTSPTRSVTVTNTGDGPLVIGTVTLGTPTSTTFPGDYAEVADACAGRTLEPGAACRVDLRHRPVAVGARPAVLTVTYAETLTFAVSLTGSGLAPTLKSSPAVTPAGRVIQISGIDFPPGSTSKLSLVGMPGATTAKARADGTFTVPFVVLPNTWTGRHPLHADVQGLAVPLRATMEFLIVPGSPVPPDFETRK